MREIVFLKQNREKWLQFEAIMRSETEADPDTLADLFVQLTDDLSYAKTFYPNSKTTRYLNGLTQKVHQAIYKNKRENKRRIIEFWKRELPLEFRSAHPQLLYAFLLFVLAGAIGALSAANESDFVRLILGDHYVNMTLENIDKGDPMAVYKQKGETSMFLHITRNNVFVSFGAFAGGFFLGIWTVYLLLYNGIMFGAFQYFFYEHGVLKESILAIYVHGTLELSAIVIAGCAGFVVAHGILFPGTYSRSRSLMIAAKKGLKIIVGLVPIFIMAGFLEGFVTRHTDMPLALNVSILAASLAFILWYFIYYPIKLERRYGRQ